MPKQVDREQDLREGELQQIQAVLLRISSKLRVAGLDDFTKNIVPLIESTLHEQGIGTSLQAGEPESEDWRPGADFGDIHVVIQEDPFQLRYFKHDIEESAEELR